jgi:hypothetical protein
MFGAREARPHVCIVGSPRIYIDRAAPGRAVVVARRMHRQPPIAVDVQNMNTAMSIDRNVCTRAG